MGNLEEKSFLSQLPFVSQLLDYENQSEASEGGIKRMKIISECLYFDIFPFSSVFIIQISKKSFVVCAWALSFSFGVAFMSFKSAWSGLFSISSTS